MNKSETKQKETLNNKVKEIKKVNDIKKKIKIKKYWDLQNGKENKKSEYIKVKEIKNLIKEFVRHFD